MSCVFGFDVGSRLTGVAIGNRLTGTARALGTLTMRDGEPGWPRLDDLHRTWQPQTLIVGLPLAPDGGEQPASRQARRFAEQLLGRYGLPLQFVDESHSSREAAARFARARADGLKRRRDAATLDAEAAAIILERWLASQPAEPLFPPAPSASGSSP